MEFKDMDILLQMEALKTEREGMVAENLQRVHREESMSFSYEEFMRITEQFEDLRNILRR